GVRQIAMASMKVIVHATKSGSRASAGMFRRGIATLGAKKNAKAAIGAPTSIKGSRRPIFVRVRSDHEPIAGCKKSAAILSSVMKKPMVAGSSLNRLAKNIGTNEL